MKIQTRHKGRKRGTNQRRKKRRKKPNEQTISNVRRIETRKDNLERTNDEARKEGRTIKMERRKEGRKGI